MNAKKPSNSVVAESAATSGLSINLHPLAILNISDHYTRDKCTSEPGSKSKLLGAILGTQNGREVSIQNSFELVHVTDETGNVKVNEEFLITRREQFSQVFPTLTVVGWYTIGDEPTAQDVIIHEQFVNANESGPSFFVLFNPDIPQNTKVLPFSVYESALPEGDQDSDKEGKFVQLDCGIETGEAERIAVDGVTKDGSGEIDQSGGKSFRRVRADDAEVASLTMQGNAIAMLYDRALVLLRYVSGVVDGTAKVDHDILRQIGALVATLPVMDVEEFHTELETEYNDVQLTAYLTTLLQQLEAFADYTDKHIALHPSQSDDAGLAARAVKSPFGFMSGGHTRARRGGRR